MRYRKGEEPIDVSCINSFNIKNVTNSTNDESIFFSLFSSFLPISNDGNNGRLFFFSFFCKTVAEFTPAIVVNNHQLHQGLLRRHASVYVL